MNCAVFFADCVWKLALEAIRMGTRVIAMAYSSRSRFDYTRDLLKDTYRPNKQTKYMDIPLPKTEEEALPNSRGIPST